MKSTRNTVMTTALGVGLIPLDIGFIHATSVFTWHLETLDESYMILVYLNLAIIVLLGSYALITQKNGSLVRPWEKHPQGKFDLNKAHYQPAMQGYAVHMGQIDASFVGIPKLRDSLEKATQIKTGVTPTAWQEKSAQSKLRQKDVDACWIRKSRESHNYS